MDILETETDVSLIYPFGKTFLQKNETFSVSNESVIQVAAGDRHTILVTASGRVFSFGDNNAGQLGLGHTNRIDQVSLIKSLEFPNTEEKVILAACGRDSSLVATNYGSLYGFGSNIRCQLGVVETESRFIHSHPVRVEYFRVKVAWKQISMGAEHTCALTNDGKVYVWGSNKDGQCGQTHIQTIIIVPTELKFPHGINFISCGYYHTGLVTKDGRLFLFGNNRDGQLGRPTPDQCIRPFEVSLPDGVKSVACGNQHTVVLTNKGDVYICGRGDHGQLGLGLKILRSDEFIRIATLPKYVLSIAAGKSHTAIISRNGDLYVFGEGKHGKLSTGPYSNKYEPYLVNKFTEYRVLDVVCGGYQTIVLFEEKQMEEDQDIETIINLRNESIKNFRPRSRSPSMNNYMSRNEHSARRNRRHRGDDQASTSSTSLRNIVSYTRSNSDHEDSILDVEEPLITTNNEKPDEESKLKVQESNNQDKKHLQTTESENLIPVITITDDFTKSIYRFSSIDETFSRLPLLNNNLHPNSYPNNRMTSLDEQSVSTTSSLEIKSLHEADIHISERSSSNLSASSYRTNSDNKNILSSTSSTASATSSSTTSTGDSDNVIISSRTSYKCENTSHTPKTKTFEMFSISSTNSDTNQEKVIKEPRAEKFSNVSNMKPPKKISKITNKHSRICSIM